jgi:hypothetical protein
VFGEVLKVACPERFELPTSWFVGLNSAPLESRVRYAMTAIISESMGSVSNLLTYCTALADMRVANLRLTQSRLASCWDGSPFPDCA